MKEEYKYNSVSLLRNSNDGILSTISKKHDKYPFGSFVTYITGRDRSIYFYLSDIAEHTKNLKNNPKGCLTISNKIHLGDKQDSQRLTIIGDLEKVESKNIDFCRERFHFHFPKSKEYDKFHSFHFYKLSPISARWIGGFGKICWLDIEEWISKEEDILWKISENKIIEHMNTDHKNSIISAINSQHNVIDTECEIIFLNKDGYYAKTNKGIVFIQLNQCVKTQEEFRKELVLLAKKYRDKEVNIL